MSRAVQVVIGIVVLVILYQIAEAVDLPALENTLEKFFLILPLAIIVLFQHEIRRALANFGTTSLWSFSDRRKIAGTFNSIGLAASTLSERRVGALIVLERLEGLRPYIENGIELGSDEAPEILRGSLACRQIRESEVARRSISIAGTSISSTDS